MRPLLVVLVLAGSLLGGGALAAAAVSRPEAARAARVAASAKARTLGVRSRPEQWRVSCGTAHRGVRRCRVSFRARCRGSVYVATVYGVPGVRHNTVTCRR